MHTADSVTESSVSRSVTSTSAAMSLLLRSRNNLPSLRSIPRLSTFYYSTRPHSPVPPTVRLLRSSIYVMVHSLCHTLPVEYVDCTKGEKRVHLYNPQCHHCLSDPVDPRDRLLHPATRLYARYLTPLRRWCFRPRSYPPFSFLGKIITEPDLMNR